MNVNLINNIFTSVNTQVVVTRKVLFEKYDGVLRDVVLTDFASQYWHYENVDLDSLYDALQRMPEETFGSHYSEEDERNAFELENVTHSIKNIYMIDGKIYGTVTFLKSKDTTEFYHLYRNDFTRISVRATGYINNETAFISDIISWDFILK